MTGPRFGYADVGRFGLAHSLLAWARCVVWCRENNAEMLAPRWMRLRIGPLLRGERDKRTYFLAFNTSDYVVGARRLWVLLTHPRISAESSEPPYSAQPASVVIFTNALADNEKKHFHEVRGRSDLLREELVRMTVNDHRPKDPERPFMAVHVRLGDFSAVSDASAIGGAGNNVRLPMSWFVDRVTTLQQAFPGIPVIVFSDGSDSELTDLLGLPGVTRAPRQAAVTDLLSIAQSAVLVSSGSGFSLWGAFLGKVPRVCFPGQNVVDAYDDPSMEVELAAGQAMPSDFLAQVRRRLQG